MDDVLIYLEPDEEITAIIDRLRGSDAESVRLIVPKGALILQSLVSLKLLKREADSLKKRIALVTADVPSQRLAAQAALTVYRKPKDSEPIYEAPRRIEDRESGGGGHKKLHLSSAKSFVTEAPEETPDGLPVHRYDQPEIDQVTEDSEEPEPPADEPGAPRQFALESRTATPIIDSALGRGGWRHRVPRLLVIAGALLTMMGLVVLAFFEFVPRVTVVLTLATEPFEQVVIVKAATDQVGVDSANARIPATRREVEVTVERQASATGKKQVGEKATATLTLYNYWDSSPQTVAAGTSFVAHDGTPFIATTAATIPGATTTLSQGKIVTTPGTTNLVVQAETAGTEGNGKSGRFIIPSLPVVRQDKIYGETQNPSAGGTSRVVTIVTSADLSTIKAAANEALLADGKTKLTEGADGRLLDGAVTVTVKSEQPSAAVGDEADTITYRLTGTVAGLFIVDQDLKDATVAILSRVIPSGRQLILRDNDTLSATAENLRLAEGTVDIRVKVTTQTALAVDKQALADSLTGKALPDAEAQLRATTGVVAVSVENRPRWLKNLPKRAGQISIKTEFAETDKTPQTNGS